MIHRRLGIRYQAVPVSTRKKEEKKKRHPRLQDNPGYNSDTLQKGWSVLSQRFESKAVDTDDRR